MDAAIEVAKVLGLPGLVVVVWYLIEQKRMAHSAKVEEGRNAALADGFKSLVGKFDTHASEDADRHGETQKELAALGGAIYTALDLTPIRQQRPKTPAAGIKAGYYAPRKPTVKDND